MKYNCKEIAKEYNDNKNYDEIIDKYWYIGEDIDEDTIDDCVSGNIS